MAERLDSAWRDVVDGAPRPARRRRRRRRPARRWPASCCARSTSRRRASSPTSPATPFVLAAGVGAIVLFVLGGSRIGTAVAAVLTSILALTQVPLYLGTGAPAAGAEPLTVMTINMHYGGGRRRRRSCAPCASATSTSSPHRSCHRRPSPRCDAAGIDDLLPHDVISPRDDASGNGLWSRTPLVTIPRRGRDAAHAPRRDDDRRRDDGDGRRRAPRLAVPRRHRRSGRPSWAGSPTGSATSTDPSSSPATSTPPATTTSSATILATGFADAASQVGAGWLPTYPGQPPAPADAHHDRPRARQRRHRRHRRRAGGDRRHRPRRARRAPRRAARRLIAATGGTLRRVTATRRRSRPRPRHRRQRVHRRAPRPELLEAGWTVRAMARTPTRLRDAPWAGDVEVAVADVTDADGLARGPRRRRRRLLPRPLDRRAARVRGRRTGWRPRRSPTCAEAAGVAPHRLPRRADAGGRGAVAAPAQPRGGRPHPARQRRADRRAAGRRRASAAAAPASRCCAT